MCVCEHWLALMRQCMLQVPSVLRSPLGADSLSVAVKVMVSRHLQCRSQHHLCQDGGSLLHLSDLQRISV